MPAGTEESGNRERVLEMFEEEAFLRSQLTVTESDYRESVLALVRLAQGAPVAVARRPRSCCPSMMAASGIWI